MHELGRWPPTPELDSASWESFNYLCFFLLWGKKYGLFFLVVVVLGVWVFFAILRKHVLCLVGLLGVPLNTEGKALTGQKAGNFFS